MYCEQCAGTGVVVAMSVLANSLELCFSTSFFATSEFGLGIFNHEPPQVI